MAHFSDLIAQEQVRTVDYLDGFNKQLALDAGLAPATVRQWEAVHAVYFGSTRFTKQQRRAREKARSYETSLAKLALIEQLIAHVAPEAERWNVRLQLLGIRGRYAALRRAAASIVPPKQPKAPVPGAWCSSTSVMGHRSLRVTAEERVIAALEHMLNKELDPSLPAAPQRLAAFLRLIHAEGGVPESNYRPIVCVPIDPLLSVIRNYGNPVEITLTASDGTTVTLAELLHGIVGDELEVAAFHPAEGALGLFRGARYPNEHQRILAKLEQPECAWVGCSRPAETSQVHHIRPWKNGGQTNIENLVPLCVYHNRVNNDDWEKAGSTTRFGHAMKTGGWSAWISPNGTTVPTTPVHSAMRQLFGRPPDPPDF